MKNITLLAALFIFQAAALPAQEEQALSQLKAVSPAGFASPADVMPAVRTVPTAVRTRIILDPATGKTYAVIPAGGGFIYAATGQFVPAVYNGHGYILRNGKYMPVVGGRDLKDRAEGDVETTGAPAKEMWTALDLAARLEQADFHVINGGTDSLLAESLNCSEDNYAACSMFVTLNGARKLVVTLDAGPKLILALASNSFYQEEENWTVGVSAAQCRKTGDEYSCTFKPYP